MARARPTRARPSSAVLVAAAGVAAIHAVWAGFQWSELLTARRGGDPFCPLGAEAVCAAVWDSAFAEAVQAWTGLPVAAWGVVWSLVALGFPLWGWIRRRRGASPGLAWPAAVATALAGVASVLLLAATALRSAGLCTTCAVTYLLVLAYAGICLLGTAPVRATRLLRGAGLAAAGTAAAFVVLLYPGLRTPRAPSAALAAIPAARADLATWVDELGAEQQQLLADALAFHEAKPPRPARPPRNLVGSAFAPVRFTEFADILCSHCKDLHERLQWLRAHAPAGAFAIDQRYFPLDGGCNPSIERPPARAVRCLAPKALICADDGEASFQLAADLFAHQRELDVELMERIAGRHLPPARLASCLQAESTEAALHEDIEWALELQITGTPLLLVNGRVAPNVPVFLYAIVLARGDVSHPAFDALPPPRIARR